MKFTIPDYYMGELKKRAGTTDIDTPLFAYKGLHGYGAETQLGLT